MVLADSLLSMSRAELVSQASGLGVERADRMTRPELRDEILRRTKSGAEAVEARGLFGIARSMIASMMETGLKMPDAAALIRGTQTLSAQVTTGAPVATVTLAEIYAAQGHPDRALTIVDRVLEAEPDHPAALRLRDRLAADANIESTSMVGRAGQAPPVLETTGEEVRTGEPPKVEVLSESPPSPAPSEARIEDSDQREREGGEEGDEGDASHHALPDPTLTLQVRGAQLLVRWTLNPGEGAAEHGPQAVSAVIRVVGFIGRPGHSGHQESRIPLSSESGPHGATGSALLDGYAGASVSAALGRVREDQFIPWTQALLSRKAWDDGTDTSGGADGETVEEA